MKKVFVRKVKTKSGREGYVVEIREAFFFTHEQIRELYKGNKRSIRLLELTQESQKPQELPNLRKISEEF